MTKEQREDILSKLEIASLEGTEFGEVCHSLRNFLEYSNAELFLSDEVLNTLYTEAADLCDEYFKETLGDAAFELSFGKASRKAMELIRLNKSLAAAGFPELWPEGFTRPTSKELEKLGRCIIHPWENYRYSAPTNGCNSCIRLYVKEQDEISAEKASRRKG